MVSLTYLIRIISLIHSIRHKHSLLIISHGFYWLALAYIFLSSVNLKILKGKFFLKLFFLNLHSTYYNIINTQLLVVKQARNIRDISCSNIIISLSYNYVVQFSRSVVSDSLQPHGLQHARLPCPLPTPGACSNSCSVYSVMASNHLIFSSLVPFSSCPQSSSESGSSPVSWFFTSGGQSIGASALILPMNIQD